MPRKPRDFDAELKALQNKAKDLKARQKTQFGDLVIATGADALSVEELAGLLLAGLEQATANPQAREGWRRRGESFFQHGGRERANGRGEKPARPHPHGTAAPGASAAAE